MKEEKTKKRRLLYYVLLAIGVCLLTAATVLTVYFVSGGSKNTLKEDPPGVTPVDPDGSGKPDDSKDPSGPPSEPDKPTGGETETFCLPVRYDAVTVYNEIYRSATTGFIYRHQGVDFMAAEGAQVSAIADGTVEKISLSERNGNLIVVDHGGGLKGYYKFVEPASTLKVGAKVEKGQNFASVAAAYGSEAKDGTHLHFELKLNGAFSDPASYLDIQYSEK